MPLTAAVSRVPVPAGSSSASLRRLLGSGLLWREVRDRVSIVGMHLPKFCDSLYWDSLTYFGWFLVLLLLHIHFVELIRLPCLFNVSLCLFVSIFQTGILGKKSNQIKS